MPGSRDLPQTIEEAVDYLLANLSLNDEIQINLMKKEDLPNLHFSLGSVIRNEMGLWSGNESLMKSCRQYAGNDSLHEDDASSVIIDAMWERLRSNDLMNLKPDSA